MEKREKRRREVPAKWVGLVGPIKPMRSSCIVVEIVFCLVVVFDDMGEFVLFDVWNLRLLLLLLCWVV